MDLCAFESGGAIGAYADGAAMGGKSNNSNRGIIHGTGVGRFSIAVALLRHNNARRSVAESRLLPEQRLNIGWNIRTQSRKTTRDGIRCRRNFWELYLFPALVSLRLETS